MYVIAIMNSVEHFHWLRVSLRIWAVLSESQGPLYFQNRIFWIYQRTMWLSYRTARMYSLIWSLTVCIWHVSNDDTCAYMCKHACIIHTCYLMFFFYVDLVFRFRQGLYNIEVNYLLSITLSWNFEYIDKGIYFLRFFIDVLLVFRFDKVYTSMKSIF